MLNDHGFNIDQKVVIIISFYNWAAPLQKLASSSVVITTERAKESDGTVNAAATWVDNTVPAAETCQWL